MTNPASPIISFDNVGKCYELHRQKHFILHEVVRKIMRRRQQGAPFWALRDISFQVSEGETVAFIGGNGAGKSTLLSLVAGTLFPTQGHIRVRGRIGALLELGAGFHPDLNGRENVYLNAALLGMQKHEIEACYDQIVDFAELGKFIDEPLRTYSSGMQVRLGFSVAVHVDPRILIMDEVLAVGDQHFQKKCAVKINEFREQKRTLLFVSHSPESVKRLCKRVIWLDQGKLVADGSVDAILPAYQEFMS